MCWRTLEAFPEDLGPRPVSGLSQSSFQFFFFFCLLHRSESPVQYWTEGMRTDILVSFLITEGNRLWSWSLKFAVGFSLSLMLFISWGSCLLFLVHWEFLIRNGSGILLNACYVSIMVIIPWRRKWQPTPLFLPEEFCGPRSLAGCSPWGRKESDMTECAHTTQRKVII